MTEIDRQAGAAAILQAPPGLWRATLAAGAAIGPAEGAPLNGHRDPPDPPVRDASIQTGAAIGTHAPFDAMPDLGVLLHATNLRFVADSCQTIPHLD